MIVIINNDIILVPLSFFFFFCFIFHLLVLTSDFTLTHLTDPRVPMMLPGILLPSQFMLSPPAPLLSLLFPASQLPLPCPPSSLIVPRLTRCFSAMPFLKKMQAGPVGNCMEGAGQSSPGANLKTAPPLPVPRGGSASFPSLPLLCQLFLPLLASPSVTLAPLELCDSWVRNLYSGWGGIPVVPASPSGLRMEAEPVSGSDLLSPE